MGGEGLPGPEGPVGPRGAVGPAGPQGPAGGLSGYEKVLQLSAADTTDSKSLTVFCPIGKTVVGGGTAVRIAGGTLVTRPSVQISEPNVDGTAWTATAVETSPLTPAWTLSVTAICAKAVP